MVGEKTALDKPASSSDASERLSSSWGAVVVRWAGSHPLAVVAMGATLIAIGHAVWIWTHRHPGGLDPDESGYIASALRMGRMVEGLDPLSFLRTVGTTGNGITVPLLSAPLAVVGPRDPRVVMLAQPALMVFTAVAVAGITRRIAGPFAAIGAGLLFASLPTVSTASQSYWYGLGAAAGLAGAMWALLTSDRCENRRIWWFGVGVGVMCLSRTMAIGYLPAAAAAGLVLAGRDRHRLLRLAASTGLGLAIAAPWYLLNRASIFGYLFSYGYGSRAARFGSGGPLERFGFRMDRYEIAFGATVYTLLWASALCIGALLTWRFVQQRRTRAHRRGLQFDERQRAWVGVVAAIVLGTAALVSTSNNGVWFELPMVPLITVALVAVIATGPRWYSVGLAVVLVVPCMTSLGTHWWLIPRGDGGPTSHYEYGFAEYDPRFGPERRAEHARAAAEWWATYEEVLDHVRPNQTGPSDPVITVSGNMQMFNANSLALVAELSGWSPRLEVPDTAEPADVRARHLTPTVEHDGRTVERIVLILRHDHTLFTPDAQVEKFARQASESGWEVDHEFELPSGGQVQVLGHQDP